MKSGARFLGALITDSPDPAGPARLHFFHSNIRKKPVSNWFRVSSDNPARSASSACVRLPLTERADRASNLLETHQLKSVMLNMLNIIVQDGSSFQVPDTSVSAMLRRFARPPLFPRIRSSHAAVHPGARPKRFPRRGRDLPLGAALVATAWRLADFQEVTASVSRWEDWCAAWSARRRGPRGDGQQGARRGVQLTRPGAHFTRAAVCYHFGNFFS